MHLYIKTSLSCIESLYHNSSVQVHISSICPRMHYSSVTNTAQPQNRLSFQCVSRRLCKQLPGSFCQPYPGHTSKCTHDVCSLSSCSALSPSVNHCFYLSFCAHNTSCHHQLLVPAIHRTPDYYSKFMFHSMQLFLST